MIVSITNNLKNQSLTYLTVKNANTLCHTTSELKARIYNLFVFLQIIYVYIQYVCFV